jgi:DNA topoisomerase VI subunit B
MRLHWLAAYSGQTGCGQECAVLFAQFSAEKRFFVMVIT